MSLSKITTPIFLALLLGACSLAPVRDVNVTAERINTCTNPPKADKVTPLDVEFKVIQDKYGIWWIAITPKHYENLSINHKGLVGHIKQKNAIVEYYKSCYKDIK